MSSSVIEPSTAVELAPPGWPRAEVPLRIAILGWARVSAQAFEGSGYNLSKSELARGLAMSGHHVFALRSGMSYRLLSGPRIVHMEDWAGIRCYELVNSPNLAPSAHNFLNTHTEMDCPRQVELILQWLDQVRAQVVHIHSLEGAPLSLIGAIADTGRPVVVTPHNYWFLCPQVDLLHKERQVCFDYEGGQRCVGCLTPHPPAAAKRKRAVGQTLERWIGMYPADVIRKAVYSVKPALKTILSGRLPAPKRGHIRNPERLADLEVALGFEVPALPAAVSSASSPGHVNGQAGSHGRAAAACTVDTEGLIRHDLPLKPHEAPRPFTPTPADANERLLAARNHLQSLNIYGQRRLAGVAALNRAAMVIPPSDFLRKVHVAMGVQESRTRWVRLGQPHFDQINRRARRSPFYDVVPWEPETATRPLRFAYFGTVRPNKGLEVLAQAIPLLSREVRQRCQFSIYASGNEWPFRKRLSLYPEVSVRSGYDLYQLIGAWGEYDVGILPHIWMENSPLVMLEHLHAGKFVISSRLGGPVDWITPPHNGLFFAAGHPEQLADCIRQLVTGQVRLPSPRQIHQCTILQSYPAHVREVESIYHEVLGRGRTPVPALGMDPGPAAAEPSNAAVHPRPSHAQR